MYAVKPDDVYDRRKDIKDALEGLAAFFVMSEAKNIGNHLSSLPEPYSLLPLPVKVLVCIGGAAYIYRKACNISDRKGLRKLIDYADDWDEYYEY